MRNLAVRSIVILALSIMALVVIVQSLAWQALGGEWFLYSGAIFPEAGANQTRICYARLRLLPRCGDTVGMAIYLGNDCVLYSTADGHETVYRTACRGRSAVSVPVSVDQAWRVTDTGLVADGGVHLIDGQLVAESSVVTAATLKRLASGYQVAHPVERRLLKINPDVPRAHSGETPLTEAVIAGDSHLVNNLLAHGANPNAYGAADAPALSYAVERKDIAIVQSLLKYGANPNARDASGRTPLLFAVMARNIETIRILVEHGGDPDIADKDGDSPRRFAQKAGWTDVIFALRQQQIRVTPKAGGRQTR